MKLQFSKFIMFLITLLFITVVVYACLYGNEENYVVLAAIIGAVGSVMLTAFVSYSKNSWIEKIARQKTEIVRVTSEERLKYNKEMLKFLNENGYSKEQLEEIEADSPMDDLDNAALESLNDSVESAMEEASTPPEIQQINI